LLAFFGFTCILACIVGFVLFRKVKRSPVRPLRIFSYVNAKEIKTFSMKPVTDTSALHHSLCTSLIFLIKSHIKQIVPQLRDYRTSHQGQNTLFDSYLQAYLSEKMDAVSETLISWLESMKDIQLHEHIIQGWLTIFEEHVKRYKAFRNEIDSDAPIKNARKPIHLDDFNEYTCGLKI
jgi:hypothetical protein